MVIYWIFSLISCEILMIGVRIAQMHHENLVSDIHNFNDYQELNHNFPFEGTSNCWICEGWAEKKFILAKSRKF